jgi:hypothetical protein
MGGKATLSNLFKISADDLDDVVGGFFRRFGFARHVIANVIFHQFGHEAVDGAASRGEALENVSTGIIGVQGAKDAFELADDLFSAIDKVEFFSGHM